MGRRCEEACSDLLDESEPSSVLLSGLEVSLRPIWGCGTHGCQAMCENCSVYVTISVRAALLLSSDCMI